jgi:hypothetical protein
MRFSRPSNPGGFLYRSDRPDRAPGRKVALATMDNATATVAALSAVGLYVVSPAASVSRIVARPTFDSGKVRGASNIEGLSDTERDHGRILSKAATSGKAIRRGILGVTVR